jgi:hypothetical protein
LSTKSSKVATKSSKPTPEQVRANERVKSLKAKLVPKADALAKVKDYEECEEVLVRGKTQFQLHPSKDEHFIVAFGKKEYVVNMAGFVKLCRLVGVPATYVRKIPNELLFPHLSYWLGDGDVGAKGFIRGGADKDGRQMIAGFAKEDVYYYPLSRIFEQVDKVNDKYLVEGLEDISWRNSTFGVVFPQFEYDVEKKDIQKGDFLYGGIKFRNSLLGEFPLKISAFLLTLSCLNGMVSVDEVYTFNRKQGFDGQDIWMGDSIRQAMGVLKAEVEKVQKLVEIPITNESIPPYISHIFDQMAVNQKSREAILTKIVEKNPRNLYQLMNAITETAHSIENRGEVMAIQSLGGFVTSHSVSCGKCKRPF